MTTQVVAFFVSYLSENQRGEPVFIKQLLSHGLYLFGCALLPAIFLISALLEPFAWLISD
jgi:hypothetical protein